ncbi:MAG: hypothetical protein Q9209_005970 [Squamulea sp. 1 TL-2023]
MAWLSPIQLPSMAEGLDIVVRLLEEQTIVVETLQSIPRDAIIRGMTVEESTLAPVLDDDTIISLGEPAMALHGPDNDLEEGEIQEEPQAQPGTSHQLPPNPINQNTFTQALYPINPFADSPFSRAAMISDLRGNNAIPTCPHCRQFTDIGPLNCHADTIQLIRSRFRLTNLAYQAFGFKHSEHERQERKAIRAFLRRRSEDNDILGIERSENWTRTSLAVRIFKQARLSLRDEAFRYIKLNRLPAADLLRIMQLTAFFENFELSSDEADLFFNPDPILDEDWDFQPSVWDYMWVNVDAKEFCDKMFVSGEGVFEGGKLVYKRLPEVYVGGVPFAEQPRYDGEGYGDDMEAEG